MGQTHSNIEAKITAVPGINIPGYLNALDVLRKNFSSSNAELADDFAVSDADLRKTLFGKFDLAEGLTHFVQNCSDPDMLKSAALAFPINDQEQELEFLKIIVHKKLGTDFFDSEAFHLALAGLAALASNPKCNRSLQQLALSELQNIWDDRYEIGLSESKNAKFFLDLFVKCDDLAIPYIIENITDFIAHTSSLTLLDKSGKRENPCFPENLKNLLISHYQDTLRAIDSCLENQQDLTQQPGTLSCYKLILSFKPQESFPCIVEAFHTGYTNKQENALLCLRTFWKESAHEFNVVEAYEMLLRNELYGTRFSKDLAIEDQKTGNLLSRFLQSFGKTSKQDKNSQVKLLAKANLIKNVLSEINECFHEVGYSFQSIPCQSIIDLPSTLYALMHHRHAKVLEDLPEKTLISGIEKGVFKDQNEILAYCLADIAKFSVLNDEISENTHLRKSVLASLHFLTKAVSQKSLLNFFARSVLDQFQENAFIKTILQGNFEDTEIYKATLRCVIALKERFHDNAEIEIITSFNTDIMLHPNIDARYKSDLDDPISLSVLKIHAFTDQRIKRGSSKLFDLDPEAVALELIYETHCLIGDPDACDELASKLLTNINDYLADIHTASALVYFVQNTENLILYPALLECLTTNKCSREVTLIIHELLEKLVNDNTRALLKKIISNVNPEADTGTSEVTMHGA